MYGKYAFFFVIPLNLIIFAYILYIIDERIRNFRGQGGDRRTRWTYNQGAR